MKYVVTLREVTVRQFIVETDETDMDAVEDIFNESEEDELERPYGKDYRDHYDSSIESIEPLKQEKP